MRTLIDNYRNLTGEHCGSTAMRNLLHYYCGLELDEAVVFGLGSGLDGLFFELPETAPPYMLFGRSISMEQDLASALALDYRETTEPDDEQAWQAVKREVLEGRPTMLSGDIYYLDYRNFKVHFPSHRFVLLGFDDKREEVYIADRTDGETQACSMEALRLSRNPPVGISTFNLWGKFHGREPQQSLADACGLALQKTAARMLGTDTSQVERLQLSLPRQPDTLAAGLAGIRALASAMAHWPQRADAGDHADYLVNAIVKFGTGGALFRNLYAGFLAWARQQRPDLVDSHCVELAWQSARQWDGLAAIARPLVEQGNDTGGWQLAQRQVMAAHATESELFERLADRGRSA